CGPSVVAHAWTQEAADRAADALMQEIALQERDFVEVMVPPEEAVARAMRIASTAAKPVVIADTQDNPGCGGTADTTDLLKTLVAADAQAAALGFLCDPDAARAAHDAGVGAEISIA